VVVWSGGLKVEEEMHGEREKAGILLVMGGLFLLGQELHLCVVPISVELPEGS
jgi:hypothetical protein